MDTAVTSINMYKILYIISFKTNIPAVEQKAMMGYAVKSLPYVWCLLLSPTTEQRKA